MVAVVVTLAAALVTRASGVTSVASVASASVASVTATRWPIAAVPAHLGAKRPARLPATAMRTESTNDQLTISGPEPTTITGRVAFTAMLPKTPSETAYLRISVHSAVTALDTLTNNSLMDATLTDDSPFEAPDVLTRVDPFINTLTLDGLALSVSIPLGNKQGRELKVTAPGVYPLTIEWRDGDKKLATSARWLVVLDTPPPKQPVTVVARIVGTPDVDSDGVATLTADHVNAFDALRRLSAAMPVSAEISGGLLPLADVSSLRASTQLLSSTYVPLDASLTALDEGIAEWKTQRAVWALAAEAAELDTIDSVAVIDRLDTNHVAAFAAQQVTTVIDLAAVDPVTRAGSTLTVVGADRQLGATMASDTPSARSQRRAVLAAPSLLDVPVEPSLIVLDLLGPDRDLVTTIINTIAREPWMAVQPLEQWQRTLSRPTIEATIIDPVPAGGERLRSLNEQRVRVTSLQAMVGRSNERLAAVTQLLLLAPASTRAADAAEVRMREVSSPLEPLINDDVSGGRSITLNVSLRRRVALPITVLVRLKVPRNTLQLTPIEKLVTLDGLGADGAATESALTKVTFAAEAANSGRVDVIVEVWTPDGRTLLVPEGRIRVRSFAVSGVGLALTFGAASLLGLWWWRHLRDRARQRRTVSS
jgi:hypothetical protein